jgi:hypothetical protein
MLLALQIVATFLTSIGWALSLAHALEMPGKLRLDRDAYVGTQSIYYPGFTIGAAFGEFGAILVTLALVIAGGTSSPAFGWNLSALVALLARHATSWIVTHPVNKFWVRGQKLGGLGAGFFGVGKRGKDIAATANTDEVWASLRDRWEYSHVARAVFAGIALICLIVATSL